MANLIDRFRSGAGRAAFEADKQRRVVGLQLAIRTLRGEGERMYGEIGQVAFALFQSGRIAQPELVDVCQKLTAIQAKIATHDDEIIAIQNEQYSQESSYGRVCPNGHGPISAPHRFCQLCGAQAIEVASPPNLLFCSHCGFRLSPQATFCSNCGQKASSQPYTPPQPAIREPALATVKLGDMAGESSGRCPQCQYRLDDPTSEFCPDCGDRLN